MKPMKRFLAFTLSLSMLMSGAAALAETDTEACTIPTDGCDQTRCVGRKRRCGCGQG